MTWNAARIDPRLSHGLGVCVFNIGLFIAVTSWPAFQRLHHHWIFPLLSVCFALEWWATTQGAGFWRRCGVEDVRFIRSSVLFLFCLLGFAGLARNQTILRCFDHCAFKLAGALAAGSVVFFAQARRREAGPWNEPRSQTAGLGAAVWAGALVLLGFGWAPWLMETGLFMAGLVFWLGRRSRARLTVALAIPLYLLMRRTGGEIALVILGTALSAFVLWAGGRWPTPLFSPPGMKDPRTLRHKIVRMLATAAVTAILGLWILGPMEKVTNPEKRRKTLLEAAARRPRSGEPLSPLARRLQSHVEKLAGPLGDRTVDNPAQLAAARDYIVDQFEEMGLKPRVLPYRTVLRPVRTHDNVEAVVGRSRGPGAPVWIVGAHYDAAEPPGADDNASGVAVLLELAREFRSRPLESELRLVAFSTEEPPFFGTQDMGSAHYVRQWPNTPVAGALVLEMLGYYNDAPRSQLYPPLLQWLRTDRARFVAAISNVSSRPLLKEFRRAWPKENPVPLSAITLPSAFSSLALSDQLNFWHAGWPALMITDTAFYRNPHYHQATDKPGTLDYPRMAAVTEGLAFVLQRLTTAPAATPASRLAERRRTAGNE